MKYNNYQIVTKGDTFLVIEDRKILYTTVIELHADRLLDKLQNGSAFRGKTPAFMALGFTH